MIVFFILVAIGIYDARSLAIWLAHPTTPRFNDFFALWTFGGFALAEGPAAIYDPMALQRFQIAADPAFTAAYPFFYPPTFLMLMIPLTLLPLAPAWLAWCSATLALYVTAVAGRAWRSRAAAAALVAPTTLLCVIAGQSGLLTGALLLGGLRALPARPLLGGALLGLLTIKPQLGLLLPVALVAAGQWRAILSATVVALALALASALAFGPGLWLVWAHTIPLGTELVLQNRADLVHGMPTVSAGFYQLGLPDGPSRLLQLAATVAAGVATWRAFRPGVTADAIAVLAMATFLATPYGFIYDLPMVTGAFVLVVLSRRPARAEALLFALIAALPMAMLTVKLPLVEPALLAAGILTLSLRRAPGFRPPDGEYPPPSSDGSRSPRGSPAGH